MEPQKLSESLKRRGAKPPLNVGGDPSAASATDTLLRLLPPYKPYLRECQIDTTSGRAHSGATTGGVYKAQGRIHRVIMKHDYLGFLVHEGDYSPRSQLRLRLEVGFPFRGHISLSQPMYAACGRGDIGAY